MNSIHSRYDGKEFISRITNDKIIVPKLALQEGSGNADSFFTKDVSPAPPESSVVQPEYQHSERIVEFVRVSGELVEHQVEMIPIGKTC